MSTATPDTNTSSGATNARGQRRGNRGGQGRRGAPLSSTTSTTGSNRSARNPSAFKGSTTEMNGHVFERYEEQLDHRQYAKTMEALEAYAKTNLQYSEDLAALFSAPPKNPTLEEPSNIEGSTSELKKMMFAEEVKEFVRRTRALRSNLATLHTVIWGQCSDDMKSKVRTHEGYKERTAENDCNWLLRQIKSVTMQYDVSKNGHLSLMEALESYYRCRQQPGQSVEDYIYTIEGWAETIESHGGNIVVNLALIPENHKNGEPIDLEIRKAMGRANSLAVAIIRGADKSRYGTLITSLANTYAMGRDEYPTDILAAQAMLVHYKTPVNTGHHQTQRPSREAPTTAVSVEGSAMTFVQGRRGAPAVAGSDGITLGGISCFNCGQYGHMQEFCPTAAASDTTTTSGLTLAQYAYMLAQAGADGKHGLDPNWILLDSQSTISVFKNRKMLTNIRKSNHVLRAITNGGYQDSDMVGDFANLGEVWFNDASIANILSLADVRKVCRVTMDSLKAPTIDVHRLDGTVMSFEEHPSGLYVFKSGTNYPVTAYTMISTVAKQKKLFTRREIDAADAARTLYRKLGRPSDVFFQKILTSNLLHDCPVTVDDAKRANIIYGPEIAAQKGKTTRSAAAPRAPTFIATPIPAPILAHHSNVTLCVDFLFVQGLGFLHTISRNIGYRTSHPVADRTRGTIVKLLKADINVYTARGLTVRDVHGDNEFECARPALLPVAMNIVPADCHVGEAERSIRTIKERLRACAHGLPFKRLPKLLVIHMMRHVTYSLNTFPWENGISDTLSPATIVTGVGAPKFGDLRVEFGAYVQVFEDHDPSNTLRARTLGAIALTPTGNAQGDYFFLSLATGHKISRHNWTEIPMTDTAIARVEALAEDEGQPLLQASGLVVEWRHDQAIDPSEYDLDYVPPDDVADVFDDATYDAIDADELAALAGPPFFHEAAVGADGAPLPGAILGDPTEADDDSDDSDDDVSDTAANEDEDDNDEEPDDDDEPGAPQEAAAEEERAPLEQAVEEEEAPLETAEAERAPLEAGATTENVDNADEGGAPATAYGLRPRNAERAHGFRQAIDAPHDGKSYFPPRQLLQTGLKRTKPLLPKKIKGNAKLDKELRAAAPEDLEKVVFGFIMNQMTAKAAIKKHGRAAEEALMKEFAQLEKLDVYEAVDPTKLTKAEKLAALRALNLVKEKRDGVLKGRTVADGRPQRNMYDKSQTASPTVATDALFLTILLDAYENRDVGTADVAGAYLKALMEDYVLMKFSGDSVDILCRMNPAHIPFVTIENGTKVLYVRLMKAIYGCVKSALLWYGLFYSHLKEMGFVLNPYDSCVANCDIDGKQCTIAWYVDDMKISHADPKVVSTIIDKIELKFDKMTVTRGREHVFLGMKIRYTGERTAVITMRQYLEEALAECGMDITREAKTPAKRCLFDVDPKSPRLETADAELFHSVSAKLLYVSLRARVDILLPIIYLCTRVTKSTTQDKDKLKRVLEYVKGTLDDDYIIGADDIGKMRTWVDAAFAVHPDMKSHTGGVISFGRGGLVCKSMKHKSNVKSSTEAETVGASDYLPHTIWVMMFLESQGYVVHKSYLEQDNESAIKMEKNGRLSAGPKSRHINIRYFWIKDMVKDANITIRHCPTTVMLADFFTKPLQGQLFHKFKAVLLGHAHVDTLVAPMVLAEERVGDLRLSNPSMGTTTGVLRTGTGDDGTVNGEPHVTWADVVKGPGAHVRRLASSERNKIVLQRAFSENNPVNRKV